MLTAPQRLALLAVAQSLSLFTSTDLSPHFTKLSGFVLLWCNMMCLSAHQSLTILLAQCTSCPWDFYFACSPMG